MAENVISKTAMKKNPVLCQIRLPNGRTVDLRLFAETPKMMRCSLVDPTVCDMLYPIIRAGVEVIFILGSTETKMTLANFNIHVKPVDGVFEITNCGIDFRLPEII